MKKISFFIFLTLHLFLKAQDETIINIGNEKISKSEFERVYLKNNKSTTPDKKSVSEYLDLYSNFRLKVLEAKNQGLDTLQSFTSELNGYRDQLAKPYLTDTTLLEPYYKESYERMKLEYDISLIYVKCESSASPTDTMKAFQKILKIRERIVKDKEPFDKVAKDASEDKYASYNGGNYGYSVISRFPYLVEKQIANAKIGELSKPFRAKMGYFIVKLNGKRADRGSVKVAHIMIMVPKGSDKAKFDSAKNKIDEIYLKVKAGDVFDELARKYSNDHSSARVGGMLPLFHSGQMVEEFEDTAFSLKKIGDFSLPCKTEYGWHIIKLIERKSLDSYEAMRSSIKKTVAKDERADVPMNSLVAKIKSTNGFKEDRTKLAAFYKVVDSTIINNQWKPTKCNNMVAMLMKIGDKTYSQRDFAYYIADPKNHNSSKNIEALVNESYVKFVNENCIEFYKKQLLTLYPDFKNIMQEYHDGILLFNITDQMVWSKAIKDTTGLKAYYEGAKQKYLWKERMTIATYTCKNSKDAEKVQKILEKDKDFKLTNEQIALKVCPKDTSHKCVTVKTAVYENGENKLMNDQSWSVGVSKVITKDSSFIVLAKKSIIPSEPKKISEARGFIIADYQSSLEEKWIKELRVKYAVVVNKDVLNQLEIKYKK